MKRISTFAIFESTYEDIQLLAPEQVRLISDGIRKNSNGSNIWSVNKKTGKVDLDATFSYSNRSVKIVDLKGIQFGNVTGEFSLACNAMETLDGAPSEVWGSFSCKDNRLTSLEGAPAVVGGSFDCSSNRLTSLEGAPKKVAGFNCSINALTSLEGAPESSKSFICVSNKLVSLEGAPKRVNGNFICNGNLLTSLQGGPEIVTGSFYCEDNDLVTLADAPQQVGEEFVADGIGIAAGKYNTEGVLEHITNKEPDVHVIKLLMTLPFIDDESIADVIKRSDNHTKLINVLKEVGKWERVKPLLGTGADQAESLADLGF